ncbi:MAG: hypothetical protein GX060_06360 [Firmicutes bacterium]|nr:hypothetical protein [Bacillota bacterium]
MMQVQNPLFFLPVVAQPDAPTNASELEALGQLFARLLTTAQTGGARGTEPNEDEELVIIPDVDSWEEDLPASEQGILAASLVQQASAVSFQVSDAAMVQPELDSTAIEAQVSARPSGLTDRAASGLPSEPVAVELGPRQLAEAGMPLPVTASGLLDRQVVKTGEGAGTTPISTEVAQQAAELQAEITTTLGQTDGQQPGAGPPVHWGQLERYWLLRNASNAEWEKAQGEMSPQGETAAGDLTAVATEKPVRMQDTFSIDEQPHHTPAPDKATVKEDEAIVRVGVVPAGSSSAEAPVATPVVEYVARSDQSLAQQIEQEVALGLRQLRFNRSPDGVTVRMQLYPEELGEVQVELKLAGDVLTAQLKTAEPQAAAALRLELPALRENLLNQGFEQVFLGAETAGQFQQTPGRERQMDDPRQQRRWQRTAIIKTETPPVIETLLTDRRLDYRL